MTEPREPKPALSPLRVLGGVSAVLVGLVCALALFVVFSILHFVFGIFGDAWDVTKVFTRWWNS